MLAYLREVLGSVLKKTPLQKPKTPVLAKQMTLACMQGGALSQVTLLNCSVILQGLDFQPLSESPGKILNLFVSSICLSHL